MKMLESIRIRNDTDLVTNREVHVEAFPLTKKPRITDDVAVIVNLGDSIGPNTRSGLYRLSVSYFTEEPCHQIIES